MSVEPPDIAALYEQAAFSGARPDPDLTVSEWADMYRQLTAVSSPEPGAWRTSRTPFLKALMDDLSATSPVERVVFMKGAQIGGTECGNNWIGYVMHQAPGPMLSVMPTVEMAKRNSKQRIGPLIQSTAVLRDVVRDPLTRNSGNMLLSKEFAGGILVMTGANSAQSLRSMAARYLFLDEVDGYPGDVDGEGDPCALAMARTSNFARRKVFVVSTPTITGLSRVERFYADSDQRQYWVPCPHCAEMIVLDFAQLRWTPGAPRTARYFCQSCSKPIENSQKEWMLPRGEWRAREVSETHGYHLSSLYSPVGWLSWADVARKREEAGQDPEKLQTFINTVLGQVWADAAERPDSDRLYERRENYPIGTVPLGGLLLTCGVDVQTKRLEAEVAAWGRNKISWSVDYRIIEGDPSQPAVWRELAELLDEDFPTAYGGTTRIQRMAIDSGFCTMAVYDFIRKQSPGRAMAVKGQTRTPTVVGVPTKPEVGKMGQRMRWGVMLYPVNTDIAKEELYRWLRSSVPDVSRGEQWPTGYCHFPDYSKAYFEGLCSEQLVTRAVGGRRVSKWEKVRDRNEPLDLKVYNRAAMVATRCEAWKENRWADLEARLTSGVRTAMPPPPQQPDDPIAPPGMPPPTARNIPQFRPIRARQDFLE